MEKCLARNLIIEMQDMNRLKNAVQVRFFDKMHERPEYLIRAFPAEAKRAYSNGMVSVRVSKSHLSQGSGVEQPLTLITSFRQFISYHLQSMKI